MTKQPCLCGRESRTVICHSNAILKCEIPCGKLKRCQHHSCEVVGFLQCRRSPLAMRLFQVCHPRECEPCDQMVQQCCSSHGTARKVICSAETGSKNTYTCGEACGKLLACGHHHCSNTCHEGPCPECFLLPKNSKTCACGQTNMTNLQRTSCLDPVR